MSPRDAGPAGDRARHARARLESTLGEASGGLLADARPPGRDAPFEYRGWDGEGTASGAGSAGTGPRLRWRLGLRAAVVLGILAIAAGAFFWWQTAAGRPEVLPLDAASEGSPAAPDPDAGGQDKESGGGGPGPVDAQPGGVVIVHVAGAVASPGVVTLPAGSRVFQAVAAAGGATAEADLGRLNLALVLDDGQKILVPRHGEPLPPAAEGGGDPSAEGSQAGAETAAGPKVNINTAGVEELDALPKVGPVLAQRIVDWRKEHGAFKTPEELDAVDGVGPKMLEALLPLVTV